MEGWPSRREWGREGGLLDRVTAEGKGGRWRDERGREGGREGGEEGKEVEKGREK